jgi:hypothetical protein
MKPSLEKKSHFPLKTPKRFARAVCFCIVGIIVVVCYAWFLFSREREPERMNSKYFPSFSKQKPNINLSQDRGSSMKQITFHATDQRNN